MTRGLMSYQLPQKWKHYLINAFLYPILAATHVPSPMIPHIIKDSLSVIHNAQFNYVKEFSKF